MRANKLLGVTPRLLRAAAFAAEGRQSFLALEVGGTGFGIPFNRVAEVRTLANASPVLQAPSYSQGFVLLHGDRVPVLDLRVDFGAPAILDNSTRLVVVWLRGEGPELSRLGLLVDRVQEVLEIDSANVEPAPNFGPQVSTDFILGCHPEGARRRLLLDVDRLLPGQS